MKFVCDRCGKKYATAGDPAPGKVYKLKCKACGHLIVVRGQAGTLTGLPAASTADAAAASQVTEPALTPPPAPRPEIELHVEAASSTVAPPVPEPAPIPRQSGEPPASAGDSGPGPLPPEVALAADTAAGASLPEPPAPPPLPLDLPEPLPATMDPALTPPPPEKDELADFAAAAAEVMAAPAPTGGAKGPGYVDLFGEGGDKKPAADPFAAAARASLPDAWAGLPPVASPPDQRAAPQAPEPPRPPPRKSGLGGTPVAIIGLGLVGLAAITAWALLGRGGSPPPVVAAPPALPAPAPPRPPEPEAKPPEPVAEPAPAPQAAEKQPEAKARPTERKAERKPAPVVERKPEPARPPPAPPPTQVAAAPQPPPTPAEPRTESRDVDLPDAAAALSQDVVNKVVGANRKAFSTCIAAAGGSGVKLDGRRVALRITVNTNGTVTYPTLDDQELNTTEMGQCLKSAARLMIFPKFRGDPFHYEVPLILTGN